MGAFGPRGIRIDGSDPVRVQLFRGQGNDKPFILTFLNPEFPYPISKLARRVFVIGS